MLSVLLLVRFVKLLSVCALFTGSIGAVLAATLEERRRFAVWLAGPGFVATWGAGFGLAYLTGDSLMTGWVMGSIALSLLSLQGVLYCVGKEGRRSAAVAAVIVLPLIACVALMVYRPG